LRGAAAAIHETEFDYLKERKADAGQ